VTRIAVRTHSGHSLKGGDPAAPSGTATLFTVVPMSPQGVDYIFILATWNTVCEEFGV